MIFETKFLISLFITLAIEVSIVLLLAKFLLHQKKFEKIFLSSIAASILTLPYWWFVLPPYLPAQNYLLYGEMLVIIAETAIYRIFAGLSWRDAFLLSLIANIVSCIIGLFLLV